MEETFPIRWFNDGRTRRAVELLSILWLLAMLDLAFTLWAHRYTPFHELNPWARAMLANHQLFGLATAKVLLTLAGTVILWSVRKHGSAQIALWLLVVAYVALMFRWSDYTTQVLGLGLVGP